MQQELQALQQQRDTAALWDKVALLPSFVCLASCLSLAAPWLAPLPWLYCLYPPQHMLHGSSSSSAKAKRRFLVSGVCRHARLERYGVAQHTHKSQEVGMHAWRSPHRFTWVDDGVQLKTSMAEQRRKEQAALKQAQDAAPATGEPCSDQACSHEFKMRCVSWACACARAGILARGCGAASFQGQRLVMPARSCAWCCSATSLCTLLQLAA